MIRNVILHLINEQPLLADLYEPPVPGDAGLRCTNLRQMNGKRPVFVDDIGSIFFFPYLQIRFVEILPGAASSGDFSMAVMTGDGDHDRPARPPVPEAEAEPDLEIDEDFLRRIREV